MHRGVWVAALLTLLAVGCAGTDTHAPSSSAAPPASLTPAAPGATEVPATVGVAAGIPALQFSATAAPIDDAMRARMSFSWHEGCPVALADLRLVTLSFWDDGSTPRTGELVVNADAVDAIVAAFRQLFAIRFPIARMQLVDTYGGDDERSMRADNTSAFNCREVAGQPGSWSEHAYGRAVDINPLVNPWVRGATVDPPEGRSYADRSRAIPGAIHHGDAVVAAFAAVGWTWGGDWIATKDYQHFSANGK